MQRKHIDRRTLLKSTATVAGLGAVAGVGSSTGNGVDTDPTTGIVELSDRIEAKVHYDDFPGFPRSILYPSMIDVDKCVPALFPADMSHRDDLVVNAMIDCDGSGTFDWFRCDPYRRDRDEGWIERKWLEFEDELPE